MNKYKEAIKVVDTVLHHMCGEEREDGYLPTMEEMSNSMDLLTDLANKAESFEWIPVSERLPEQSLNSVLGWDAYRECCCFVQYYNNEWILGNHETVKIIAWMPLPKPYKEEENENDIR